MTQQDQTTITLDAQERQLLRAALLSHKKDYVNEVMQPGDEREQEHERALAAIDALSKRL